MLKIAYIGQKGVLNAQGGGVETHVAELSVRMAGKGHTVFLYTRGWYTPKEYTKFEGVNLVSLPSIHTKNLDAISHTFVSILHAIKHKVDIIHFHGVGPSILSFLPKIFAPNIKVICTAHSDDWHHSKWGGFARTMLKFGAWMSAKVADEVITVSKDLQKRYLNLYNRSIGLIPNGVSLPDLKTIDTKALETMGLQKGKYVLVVSRIVRHKGIHFLIEAFKQIKQNPKFADFKLLIVGDSSFSDNYFSYLQEMVTDRDDVVFAGPQQGEKLEQFFAHSYLYASGSIAEGLSIALLEAMSYGIAPLVSDITSNLDVVSGDSTLGCVGFTFANRSVPDLKDKLELLLQNPEVVRKVSLKARNYVNVYYNWDDLAGRIERLYKSSVVIKQKIRNFRTPSFALNR